MILPGRTAPQPGSFASAGTAPSTPALPQISSASSNPLNKFGQLFLLCYLFIALSRILDVTAPLRAAAFFLVGIVATTLFSGGANQIFRSKVGTTLVALSAWLTLSLPFSSWPTGSLDYAGENLKALVLAAAIFAIPRSLKDVTQLIKMVAFAILTASILGFVYGTQEYGRLVLNVGTYADPNQFGMTLLLGIPIWILLAQQITLVPLRIVAYVCVIPILISFLRTGSRGAIIALGLMLLLAFFRASMKGKLLLVITLVGGSILSVAFLPSYLTARYFTIFSADQETVEDLSAEDQRQLTNADVGSSNARFQLLKDSLELTIMNPIFGVGLGQFKQMNWERRQNIGTPGPNTVTHNAYTEFSSEAGIPALLIFLTLLFHCFRTNNRVRTMARQGLAPPDAAMASEALQLSLVVLVTCAFFLNVAYSQLFYIIGALIARLHMTVLETAPAYQQAAPVRAAAFGPGAPQPGPGRSGRPTGRRPSPFSPSSPTSASPIPAPASAPTSAPGSSSPGRAPRNRISPWRTPNQSHVRNRRLS